VPYIFNPKLTALELLQSVCVEFRVTVAARDGSAAPTLKDHVDALNEYLLRTHAAGYNCVLIIDEAQNLAADVLEQLRLLTNLETNERKLLQIILIGQPELRDMLARPELEQLAQRVVARFHLDPLGEDETAHYIKHRLSVAGMSGLIPFDRDARHRIHELTRGVPRRINLLCDRALLGAYASGRQRVDRTIVDKAASEVFDLGRNGAASWQRRRTAWIGGGIAVGALVAAGVAVALVSGPRRAGESSAAAAAGAASAASNAAAASAPASAAAAASAPAAASAVAEPKASAATPAATRRSPAGSAARPATK
jgi:general secretion pathway protein A